MKQADDQDIIQLFAQGASKREQAFVLLTTKYGDRLYHQIFRYVRNSEDSNDVLQNVLIKIYRNLENFKGDSALYTWMYQIARNESLNFIASNKKRVAKSIDQSFIQIATKDSELPDADVIEGFLMAGIEQLPEKQALVFQLRYFDELPFAEISVLTNTSEGSLKASYHIARQKIEDFLRGKLNHYL